MNLVRSVSVIIPCRNEAGFIGKCLDSILAQDFPIEKLEIIVVDGMSSDASSSIIRNYQRKYPQIRLVENRNKIVPAALNLGIQHAAGDVIIIMGAHTEYAHDYISQCVKTLETTGADNVGGSALTKAKSFIQQAIALAFKSPFGVGGAKSHRENYEGPVDTVTYGCYRRETFEKIGLFDEELVRNQDDEFNLRLTRAGGKIWQSPLIRSWYYPRSSLKALFKQYMQYGYWKVRVIQKHRLPASIRHIIPGTFVGGLLFSGLLALFLKPFRLIFILIALSYLLVNLAATTITCHKRSDWRYIPLMPIVFFIYHFSYGYGFIRGVIDFLILKKSSGRGFTQISRR